MANELTTNFAVSTVATAPSPATSGTSLVVASGEGSRFPDPASQNYNVVVCPSNERPTPANSEIVRVTAKSTDTLTITRTQESTSARTVVVGDLVFLTPTAKDFTDIYNTLTFLTAAVGGAIAASNIDAKGDLLAGTADNTFDNLAVGSNGQTIQADSSQSMGMKWARTLDGSGQAGIWIPQGSMAPAGLTNTNMTANRAWYLRFVPTYNFTATSISFCLGSTVASSANDQADVGIFSWSGSTLTRIASAGATTGKLNSAGVQNIAFTAGVALTAGTSYYAALSCGTFTSTTPQFLVANYVNAGVLDMMCSTSGTLAVGTTESMLKGTAHPLGSSVTTFTASTIVPIMVVRE